jgi:hypothetical protein
LPAEECACERHTTSLSNSSPPRISPCAGLPNATRNNPKSAHLPATNSTQSAQVSPNHPTTCHLPTLDKLPHTSTTTHALVATSLSPCCARSRSCRVILRLPTKR